MKKITTKLVFDRKKVTDKDKNKKGLLQLQCVHNRKQMFVSTGIKLKRNQWDARNERVTNTLTDDELNSTITAMLRQVERYNADAILCGCEPSLDELKIRLEQGVGQSFIDYVRARIRDRRDIRETTRKMHGSVINVLEEYGKIVLFTDVTYENIVKFDEWMHDRGMMQSSIYTKHKCLKHYISEAVLFDRLPKNPYKFMKLRKGKSDADRWISADDMDKVMDLKLSPRYERIRDLMVFQFYTGMAWADIEDFDYSRIKDVGGQKVYVSLRHKTDQKFVVALLPMAEDVLKKHGNKLPKISQQKYNDALKTIAEKAELDCADRIASHWLRRSYAMWLLNNGVKMEVVSRSLGHATVKQTQQSYAYILEETIAKEMGILKNA